MTILKFRAAILVYISVIPPVFKCANGNKRVIIMAALSVAD